MAGVELSIAGWLVTPLIQTLLDKAKKYLGANWELQKGTQEMVEDLTRTLLLCQSTVKEIEKKAININNTVLAHFLRKQKEAIYDVEDVLDNMEAKSIKEKVRGKNKVRKIASSSLSAIGNMFSPDDNLKSFKKVVDQLNQLSIEILTINELVYMNYELNKSYTRQVMNTRETISRPLEEVDLYGREDELILILDIILGSQSKSSKKGGLNYENYHHISVIPIVGMGGVGKTALAQTVYNHPAVQQTFAKRAWISSSNNRDLVSVMSEICQSLSGYPVSYQISVSNNLDVVGGISKHLSSIIGGVGKFLIVLDDMFEMIKHEWEFLYEILSHGAPGSVILITTQNQIFSNRVVGNTAGAVGPIALSVLDSGVFWELFERFLFGNVVMSEEKRIILQTIGQKIADKLHGLPLAAKIIGNVLHSDLDEHRWEDILKSEWWDIPEGQSKILPSIGLGYKQLNPSLQQCFAYCSLFPRSSLIEKDRLVHMWIAQNFIIQSDVRGVMRLEVIGRQWFDELVERSFFQRAGDNNSYVMHDLMHDLAVIVSSGECFYLGEGVNEIPLGVRHLAVDTNNLDVIKGIREHKNLRSLLYFGRSQVEGMYSAINNTLSYLDSIRVLDLSNMHMEKELKPPPAIWKLKHLRFLDLSSTGIKLLTHSSIDLYHLQALYIRKCELLEVPRGLNKLINLRHFCADEQTSARISGMLNLPTSKNEGEQAHTSTTTMKVN